MNSASRFGRRAFVGGAMATGLAITTGVGLQMGGFEQGLVTPAFAQSNVTAQDWQKLVSMVEEARKLGVSTPLVTIPAQGSERFEDILQSLLDFVDDLRSAPANPQIIALRVRASAMLTEINRRERSKQQQGGSVEPFGWLAGFIAVANAQDDQAARYERYKGTYAPLFDTCRVRPERVDKVEFYVSKILKYRPEYDELEKEICVPWYVIGVLHALEATFNFDTHLHNGDPLTARTVLIPKGRPEKGSPPFEWTESAKDALGIKNYNNRTDWHLASTLFRIERYNGFRSRELHKINSPYLWSFSQHYTRGKYVRDNVWDEDAVSGQCGAAVILKVLTDRKAIQIIA